MLQKLVGNIGAVSVGPPDCFPGTCDYAGYGTDPTEADGQALEAGLGDEIRPYGSD